MSFQPIHLLTCGRAFRHAPLPIGNASRALIDQLFSKLLPGLNMHHPPAEVIKL
jgi:hypothetical protein